MKKQREAHAEMFARYMADAMKRTGLRQRDIVKSTGLSRATVSNYVGCKPNTATGKPMLPERETVDKIAYAFGDPPALARQAAGYSANGEEDTIEGALEGYFSRKGLGEEQKDRIRPVLEMLEREIDLMTTVGDYEITRSDSQAMPIKKKKS